MASILRLGQVLRGKFGTYTISKQLQDTAWFAKFVPRLAPTAAAFKYLTYTIVGTMPVRPS